MKLDKDFVIKNRFWMLFGLAMPMSLVVLFLLFTVVTAGIDEKLGEIEKQLKDLVSAGNGDLPNNEWIKLKKDEADKLKLQEDEVWKSAYFAQDFLASWPKAFEESFNYSGGYFARQIDLQKKVDNNEKEFFKGELPADNDKEFHGILHDFDEDFILVKGFDKEKNIEIRRFQRTEEIKVSIEGETKFFPKLQDKEGYAIKVTYEKSRYFDDPLTDPEIRAYADSYREQIPDILQMVEPVNVKNEGVVQLRDWPYEKGKVPPDGVQFLRFKIGEWIKTSPTVSSEAWVAQEDLWVQREIYRMVRQANDYVAKFKGEGGKQFKKPYVFTNPNWKVEITWLGGKEIEYTIHNQLGRKQKVDVGLRIKIHENPLLQGEVIVPPSEPLSQKNTPGLDMYKGKHKFEAAPQGIFGVEQVLNWETAAVKRIDFISIGAQDVSHSHRTLPLGYKPLKPPPVTAVPVEGSELGGQLPPGGGGEPGREPGPAGILGEGGMGMLQGALLSPNGLVLDRYLDVRREARRIPVAVVLIIDQEHLDRVQTSFVNSKLRFLTTQCIMSRYPFSLRPNFTLDQATTLAGGPGSDFGPGPGIPGAGFGGGFGRGGEGTGDELGGAGPGPIGGFGPGPLGGFGSGMPGEGGVGPTSSTGELVTDDTEANVELVIYGIVTMYQRYPARPPEAAAPADQSKESKDTPPATPP